MEIVDANSLFTPEVIDAINNINPVTQRLRLGDIVSQFISAKNGGAKKLPYRAEIGGTVNVSVLKTAYNSLIRELIECGYMEASAEK